MKIDYLHIQTPYKINHLAYIKDIIKNNTFELLENKNISFIGYNSNHIILNYNYNNIDFNIKLNRKSNFFIHLEIKSEQLLKINKIDNDYINKLYKIIIKEFQKLILINPEKELFFKIIRIDLCKDFFDSDLINSILNLKENNLITKLKNFVFYYEKELFTGLKIYGNNINFRIYNKKLEIKKNKNLNKIHYYKKKLKNKYEKSNIWRLEFEITGKYLKKNNIENNIYPEDVFNFSFFNNLINIILKKNLFNFYINQRNKINLYFWEYFKNYISKKLKNKDINLNILDITKLKNKIDWLEVEKYKKVIMGYKKKLKKDLKINDYIFYNLFFKENSNIRFYEKKLDKKEYILRDA